MSFSRRAESAKIAGQRYRGDDDGNTDKRDYRGWERTLLRIHISPLGLELWPASRPMGVVRRCDSTASHVLLHNFSRTSTGCICTCHM